MSRTDDTRPPAGLGPALDLMADEIPEHDVAEATWARGRTVRRRRHAVAVGGMTSVLVAVVVGWAALSPQEGAPMLPARTPEGTTTDEARTSDDPDPGPGLAAIVTARAEALRDRLEADCPSADLAECTRLYRFGPEVDQEPVGGRVDTDTQLLMETVYRHYAEAAECLQRQESLILTVPDEHAFVWEYAIAGTVPWHPYLGVRGRSVQELHEQCPIRPWEEAG